MNKTLSSRRRIILITGGIGSGKSVVSDVLRIMGYEVYDCDSEAKALMDVSEEIKHRLQQEIDTDVVRPDGNINRGRLAAIVFDDKEKLKALNRIVHQVVRDDIKKRASEGFPTAPLFIETAIPKASRLTTMAWQIWQVTAPDDLRVERVMERDSYSHSVVMTRLEAQAQELCQGPKVREIVNDDTQLVVPQILYLLRSVTLR